MEINGVAHLIFSVRDMDVSKAFYAPLLERFGLVQVVDSDVYHYWIGGRTGVGLRPATSPEPFDQGRVGLHHACFRARSREDVDEAHALLVSLGARVVHPPEEAAWAPGYYSVLFEDPDGIRIEVNFVPGKGLFEPGARRGGPEPT